MPDTKPGTTTETRRKPLAPGQGGIGGEHPEKDTPEQGGMGGEYPEKDPTRKPSHARSGPRGR